MRRDDPFEKWDIASKKTRHSLSPQLGAQWDAEARAALDELQQFLDRPLPRRSFWDVRFSLLPQSRGLPSDQLARAQDLYRRLVATGGAGNTYIQEYLLDLLAATEDSASIPFWLDIVNLARPRDSFATKRCTYAVAALARLAIVSNLPETYAALSNHATPAPKRPCTGGVLPRTRMPRWRTSIAHRCTCRAIGHCPTRSEFRAALSGAYAPACG